MRLSLLPLSLSMVDSRSRPSFGPADLAREVEPNASARRVAKAPSLAPLELDEDSADGRPPPPSTSRVYATDGRPTPRNLPSVHDELTRVAKGEALSLATRPAPSPSDDESTRAWAELDEALLSVGEHDSFANGDAGNVVQRTRSEPAPPGSGVAARHDRVAAMRELYAKGDAEGALALAAELGAGALASPSGDYPDASIMVEYGEQSIELDDAFGGLEPIDEVAAAAKTAPPPAPEPPLLTLTERHSIPRMLKSLSEISHLKIDHRSGFLLAHIDGMHTLEELLDVCAMPAAEALALVASLKEMGVIELE